MELKCIIRERSQERVRNIAGWLTKVFLHSQRGNQFLCSALPSGLGESWWKERIWTQYFACWRLHITQCNVGFKHILPWELSSRNSSRRTNDPHTAESRMLFLRIPTANQTTERPNPAKPPPTDSSGERNPGIKVGINININTKYDRPTDTP